MRNSVDACRYVLEMCTDAAWRPDGAGDDSDDREADRPRDHARLSAADGYGVRCEAIAVWVWVWV